MITIVLCDDDAQELTYYLELLEQIGKKNNLEMRFEVYQSAESLLFHLSEKPDSVDIIYLDIELCKQDGISAAKELRNLGCTAEIIFLTSHRNYVFDSFESQPFEYLIKHDTNDNRFEAVFLRAVGLCRKSEQQTYLLHTKKYFAKLHVRDISYIEVYHDQISIHYKEQLFVFPGVFSRICEQFEPMGFLRINRCYLMNPDHLCFIRDHAAHLYSGETLAISRKYRKSIENHLTHRYFGPPPDETH